MSRESDPPLIFDANLFNLHCAHCGYSLLGLQEPRCPECGQPVEWKRLTEIGSIDLSELNLAARATQLKLGLFWGVVSTLALLVVDISLLVPVAIFGAALSMTSVIPTLLRRAKIERVQRGACSRLQGMGLLLAAFLTFIVTYVAVLALLSGLIATLFFVRRHR